MPSERNDSDGIFAATLLFLIVRRRQIPHPVITPDGGLLYAILNTRLASSVYVILSEAARGRPHPPCRLGTFSRGVDSKAEDVASQGHGAEVADVIEDIGRLVFGGAEDVEEGQKVVGGRDGVVGVGVAVVVDDGFVIALLDGGFYRIVEAVGGWISVLVLSFDAAQVVDNVAASHDEVALLAQAGELLAELVGGVLGDVAVDGELDDGDVGLWEDVDEDAPRAVVDAPAVVDFDVCAEQVRDVAREVCAAGRLVLEGVELRREAVHVVDLARRCGALHERAVRVPVRRDHQDGLGLAEFLEDALPEAVVGVGQFIMVECDHRAAVSDENSGHLFHGDSSFLVVFPIKVSFLY